MKLCYGLDMDYVDPIEFVDVVFSSLTRSLTRLSRITKKVISGVYQGVTTVELDVSYPILILIFHAFNRHV